MFSQDGTRAYQTTTINDPGTGSSSTVVAVIDPTDGSVISDPLTLNGYPERRLVFSQDGTRAYQLTIVYDPATESNTTVVTAIDSSDGSVIGDPLTLNGYPSGGRRSARTAHARTKSPTFTIPPLRHTPPRRLR